MSNFTIYWFGTIIVNQFENKNKKYKTMFRKRKNPMDFMSQMDSMFDSFMSSPFNSNLIMGNINTESGSDENGNWTKQSFTSDDGSISITSVVRTNFDSETPKTTNKLDSLKKKLDVAVEKQNFEEAVKLRDEIKKVEKNKGKIDSLKSELDKAINEQNYEKAIELRDKIKELE